ncbi:hypothetical protein IFM89_014649 [Coptis chinensis]|uniref:Uncharacterized protein n=1 Tax=Coptis chinensis TaxID=261450 RepID=A0A835H6B5_9MAGN|nr:hypothetical protein IFM89_014649 [Coptis chinensis]
MKGALQIVSGFVKEHIEDRRSGKQMQRTDFLDVLLDYEGEGEGEPDKLSERQLAIFILERLGFTLRKYVPLKAIPKRTNVYK